MFDVAGLLGDALREVKTRDGPYLTQNNIDASANFIVGGQIRGEPHRLFRGLQRRQLHRGDRRIPATSRSASRNTASR